MHTRAEPCPTGRLTVRSQFAFEGEFFATGKPDIIRQSTPLDDVVVAAWLLMSNVAQSTSRTLQPALEAPGRGSLVDSEYIYYGARSASPAGQLSGSIRLIFHWPIPGWKRLLEYQRLYFEWDKRAPLTSGTAGDLARVFLALVLEIGGRKCAGAPTWDAVASAVVDVSREISTELGHWAISHAGLLAAPESGIPAQDANGWLAALKSKAEEEAGRWDEYRERLKGERLQWHRLAVDEAAKLARAESAARTQLSPIGILEPAGLNDFQKFNVSHIANLLDSVSSDYEWRSLISPITP